MVRAKQRVIGVIREYANQSLGEVLRKGVCDWPLPPPPLVDSDFPPITPSDPEKIIEQGLGLFELDQGMFLHHLNSTIELVIPYRMSLSEEVFEEHEKWLIKRKELVVERILFATCISWLADSLDESMPNTDKWWISVALFNGLITNMGGQAVHQGFHILESIAIATKPGAWHSKPESGPHQMEWDFQASLPKYELKVHNQGLIAANWILTILMNSNEARRQLLVEWILLLLERKELITPLDIGNRMIELASDESNFVSSRVVVCIPRLIEADIDTGKKVLAVLNSRCDTDTKRALADILTRLFKRMEADALPLYEEMIESADETVLAACSATVGDIKFIDKTRWADEILRLTKHPVAIVRRNIVATLRDYVVAFPNDERGILVAAWLDGDEVVGTRLRELLIRMEEVDPDSFSSCIRKINNDENGNLKQLWEVIELRKPGQPVKWKLWLDDKGPPPSFTVKAVKPIQTTEEPYNLEDVEIPNLNEALENLDKSL